MQGESPELVSSKILTSSEMDILKAAKYSDEQIQRMQSSLKQIYEGTALSRDDAAEAAEMLNALNRRGILNFHRTAPESLDQIESTGEILPGKNHHQVFALPYHTSGNGNLSAGKSLGNSMIVFQGQAANLFSNRGVRGPLSAIGSLQNHQVVKGKIIIEEAKRLDDGTLIIIKARTAPNDGSIFDRSRGYLYEGIDNAYLPTIAVGAGAIFYKNKIRTHLKNGF